MIPACVSYVSQCDCTVMLWSRIVSPMCPSSSVIFSLSSAGTSLPLGGQPMGGQRAPFMSYQGASGPMMGQRPMQPGMQPGQQQIQQVGGRQSVQLPIQQVGGRRSEQQPIQQVGRRQSGKQPIQQVGWRQSGQQPIQQVGWRQSGQQPIQYSRNPL